MDLLQLWVRVVALLQAVVGNPGIEMVNVMQARGVRLPHLLEYLPTLCRYYLEQRVGRGGIPRELSE